MARRKRIDPVSEATREILLRKVKEWLIREDKRHQSLHPEEYNERKLQIDDTLDCYAGYAARCRDADDRCAIDPFSTPKNEMIASHLRKLADDYETRKMQLRAEFEARSQEMQDYEDDNAGSVDSRLHSEEAESCYQMAKVEMDKVRLRIDAEEIAYREEKGSLLEEVEGSPVGQEAIWWHLVFTAKDRVSSAVISRGMEHLRAEIEKVTSRVKSNRATQYAYLAHKFAEKSLERELKDRESHEWLGENLPNREIPGIPEDYELPAFATYRTYVSAERREQNDLKYRNSSSREGTRSVKRREDLD